MSLSGSSCCATGPASVAGKVTSESTDLFKLSFVFSLPHESSLCFGVRYVANHRLQRSAKCVVQVSHQVGSIF